MWTDVYAPIMEVSYCSAYKIIADDAQADLALGKARVAKVKNWLHEALYGVPAEYAVPGSGPSQLGRDKVRKYKVCSLLALLGVR
jgi:cell cycle checkpoint protein